LRRSIAELTTTVSACPTLRAPWPIVTCTPSRRSCSISGVTATSDPETTSPRASKIRAIALMPMPPTPMR
jgi:hypothetical protein